MNGSETGTEGEEKQPAEGGRGRAERKRRRRGDLLLGTDAPTGATAALRRWFVWWFVAGLRRRRRFSAVASSKQAGTCPDRSKPATASRPVVAVAFTVAVVVAVPANTSTQSRAGLVLVFFFGLLRAQLPRADGGGRLVTLSPKLPMILHAARLRKLGTCPPTRQYRSDNSSSWSPHEETKTPRARPIGHSPELRHST